jgi:hypothetical protein
MAAPSPGVLRIAGQVDTTVIGMLSIVRIHPLEQRLVKQLDGSVDLGFNLASANHLAQLSFEFSLLYRTRERTAKLSGNSQMTRQDDVADVERSNLTITYSRVLTNRWFAQAATGTERNSELGIDLRWSLSGLGGRYLVQSNSALFGLGAGLSGSLENPSEDESRWNTEFVAGIGGSVFSYDFPKTDAGINVSAFRDLTRDRVRAEADAHVKREIIKDFTVGITGAESFDSVPPAGGTEHDWTLKFTVGWTY